MKELAEALTTHERRVLEVLKDGRERSSGEIAEILGMDRAAVERALMFLDNKNLVRRKVREVEEVVFTEKGEKYLQEPLPEDRLVELLKSGPVPVKDLDEEARIGLGILKRKGVVEIRDGKVHLVGRWEPVTKRFREKEPLDEFFKRGLLKRVRKKVITAVITELGRKIVEIRVENLVDVLTPEDIRTGAWRRKKYRRLDVVSPLPKEFPGRRHPLRELEEYVREILLSMGFKEMEGPWVELAFWNFDAMFQPQDHPARELHDTIYLSSPSESSPPQKILGRVREVHKRCWGVWSDDVPKRLVMRTHTTAVTFRKFFEGIEIPGKYFAIGRVFRNETIDWKHLSEFHQIEGFVAAEGLSIRHLMGMFVEFYRHFGIKRLKFKPVYNPYTEPSMEIFGWHPEKKTWVEIGNSGMFRPEALEPYGIEVPVIAWGLALERLALLVYDIDDIRRVFGPAVPLEFIRERGMAPWLRQG